MLETVDRNPVGIASISLRGRRTVDGLWANLAYGLRVFCRHTESTVFVNTAAGVVTANLTAGTTILKRPVDIERLDRWW